jgi:hypothetical protein
MSFGADKVSLCRLYERLSQNGRRYLAGRLGSAKVIADDRPFYDDPIDDIGCGS